MFLVPKMTVWKQFSRKNGFTLLKKTSHSIKKRWPQSKKHGSTYFPSSFEFEKRLQPLASSQFGMVNICKKKHAL